MTARIEPGSEAGKTKIVFEYEANTAAIQHGATSAAGWLYNVGFEVKTEVEVDGETVEQIVPLAELTNQQVVNLLFRYSRKMWRDFASEFDKKEARSAADAALEAEEEDDKYF